MRYFHRLQKEGFNWGGNIGWTVPLRPIEKITMWLHYCGTTPSNLCLYKIHAHISFEQKPKSKNLFLTRHSSSLGVFYSIHLQVVKRMKMGVHSETHWNVFRITTVATHVPYKTKVSLSKPHHVVQIFDILWYLPDRYMPLISWQTKTTGNYFTLSCSHTFMHSNIRHLCLWKICYVLNNTEELLFLTATFIISNIQHFGI